MPGIEAAEGEDHDGCEARELTSPADGLARRSTSRTSVARLPRYPARILMNAVPIDPAAAANAAPSAFMQAMYTVIPMGRLTRRSNAS